MIDAYVSPPPNIVGGFDGKKLQRQLESVGKPDGSSTHAELLSGLCKINNVFGTASVASLYRISWTNPEETDIASIVSSCATTNFKGFQSFQDHSLTDESSWHIGQTYGGVDVVEFHLLTASSNWPFSLLVGEVSLEDYEVKEIAPDFWQSDTGQHVIKNAIDSGDLEVMNTGPNEVVAIPSATLRRDTVPVGAEGYRYHMRSLARISILESDVTSER